MASKGREDTKNSLNNIAVQFTYPINKPADLLNQIGKTELMIGGQRVAPEDVQKFASLDKFPIRSESELVSKALTIYDKWASTSTGPSRL